MMVFGFFKKQLLDVIDWTETSENILCFRYPMEDREIQNGAQLTVRQSQVGLLVNEGQVADLFGPGMHTLQTRNLPVLTNLKNWEMGFQSPFKSDLYFFSMKEQIDQKWGTATPITVRDKEFGIVRMRAYGTYSYKIRNPKVFFEKIVGSRDSFSVSDLEGQLKASILTALATYFGQAQISFLDMAGHQEKLSVLLKEALKNEFDKYGLLLESFLVQSVSLPEEVQSQIDKMTSMKIAGDMKQYTQFQAAESLTQPNTNTGVGVELAAAMSLSKSLGETTVAAPTSGGGNNEDVFKTISQLHELKTKGIISENEFEAKKADLLSRIK
ncbi:MAG: SPFH domain-containing protein [Bdellovibrionaceae bacterium]|nr:SPFH domain-containing protein [Pseudobdellovibrionaceae bacterium]